jgi:hypothetical protein
MTRLPSREVRVLRRTTGTPRFDIVCLGMPPTSIGTAPSVQTRNHRNAGPTQRYVYRYMAAGLDSFICAVTQSSRVSPGLIAPL